MPAAQELQMIDCYGLWGVWSLIKTWRFLWWILLDTQIIKNHQKTSAFIKKTAITTAIENTHHKSSMISCDQLYDCDIKSELFDGGTSLLGSARCLGLPIPSTWENYTNSVLSVENQPFEGKIFYNGLHEVDINRKVFPHHPGFDLSQVWSPNGSNSMQTRHVWG